ncbi:peptidoglycan recognition protein family protein [Haloferula sp.]|uniref:peptidoglycan recognition protein family protein n=1 Tax=Haloferula sp. TaxID=2497595 RepID=UPI003C72F2EF
MKWPLVLPFAALSLAVFSCMKVGPIGGYEDASVPIWGSGARGGTTSVNTSTSAAALIRQVNLKVDMVPKGTHGRRVVRPMKPRYITIHSTQNYSAGAERHSLALKRGALRASKRRGGNRIGYLIWHYTVDEKMAIQHMPTNEQGEHADFDGPGNRYSIGIEMCEERGSNINATIDRTAKLTAYLMHKNGIPLSRVVPHYHWPRKGTSRPHKNCPHFLLDNGRPGRKWKAFQGRINSYYKQINSQSVASR